MIMRTNSRLSEAYKNARVEYFDDDSKYIFFSDCHRSDGSLSDEFNRNKNIYLYALEYYFKNGFVYVEAGDGDELWEHRKFKDIVNANHDVFEAIKKFFYHDRLIMLYGNHNVYLKNQEYVKNNYYYYYDEYHEMVFEFLKGIKPCEALVLKYKKTGQDILTVHGHQGDLPNDQFWVPSMLSLKYFWRFMHSFGFQNPSSPVKNAQKRHKIEKNYCKWIDENRIMLICGHTHRSKFPKRDELPYFNTGCCIFPSSITGIEITNGSVLLIQWKIRANRDGILQIERNILRGPEPLEKYDIRNTTAACGDK